MTYLFLFHYPHPYLLPLSVCHYSDVNINYNTSNVRQVCWVSRLILVLPATNAASERSFYPRAPASRVMQSGLSVYIYICVQKKFVIERTRDLIYLKFVATDFFLK